MLLLLLLLLLRGGAASGERGREPSREQGAVKMSLPPAVGGEKWMGSVVVAWIVW